MDELQGSSKVDKTAEFAFSKVICPQNAACQTFGSSFDLYIRFERIKINLSRQLGAENRLM